MIETSDETTGQVGERRGGATSTSVVVVVVVCVVGVVGGVGASRRGRQRAVLTGTQHRIGIDGRSGICHS